MVELVGFFYFCASSELCSCGERGKAPRGALIGERASGHDVAIQEKE